MRESTEVAILYHYVAHYRRPIFEMLCTNEEGCSDYEVYASNIVDHPALAVISPLTEPEASAISKKWNWVSNHFFGPFLWQSGSIKLALGSKHPVLILLGNAYFLSTWVAAILARLRGKKVLMWTHGYKAPEDGIKGWIRYSFYRLADGLLLYGHRAERILIEKGYPPNRLFVIYNSLDYEKQHGLRFRATPEARGLTRQKYMSRRSIGLVIASGRLTKTKNIELLVQSVAQLKVNGYIADLLIVGDGPELESISAKIDSLEVSGQVHMYGECYDEQELARLFSAADLLVIPGDIGLSCIHALSYGVPVVTHGDFTTQNPEVEAIVRGVNGDFFEKDDVLSLAQKMHEWLARMSNPSSKEKVVSSCLEIVEDKYNPSAQKALIENAVKTLLQS